MRHSARTRLGVLTIFAALAIAACGGFSGATEAPSAAPGTEAPAASEAPTASAVSDEPVTLTYYVDDNNVTQARLQGLTEAYMALHPNVTFEIETHPGGTEGDNLVKTRLATGEMSDIFYYNSGSLFQALNPTESLVDLSGEPFIENMVEAYLPTVSAGDGIYGVPTEGSLGGGILYNNKIYGDLGLTVPKTWEEFAANNEKIKEAGTRSHLRDVRRHLDITALRAGGLLQRAGGRARLRREVHGQRGSLFRHAGCDGRLPAHAGST